jgi:uncharacterized membrane protein YedE/YeeE
MDRTTLWRLLIGVWVSLALVCLILALILFHDFPINEGRPNDGVESVLGYFMLVLCFPSGWISLALIKLVQTIASATTGKVIPTSYAWLTVEWLVFLVTGYVQWFVLLPWLLRKWQTRRVGTLV